MTIWRMPRVLAQYNVDWRTYDMALYMKLHKVNIRQIKRVA